MARCVFLLPCDHITLPLLWIQARPALGAVHLHARNEAGVAAGYATRHAPETPPSPSVPVEKAGAGSSVVGTWKDKAKRVSLSILEECED